MTDLTDWETQSKAVLGYTTVNQSYAPIFTRWLSGYSITIWQVHEKSLL